MVTAILRSYDCLRDRFNRPLYPNPNPNPNPRFNPLRSNGRKRSPTAGNPPFEGEKSSLPLKKSPPKGLVMGEVKILKRGEELNPSINGGEDLTLCSTDRLGPDPEVLHKQIRVPDLYAGTVSLLPSPPPSSLPFPAALVRSSAASEDLRRLLGI